MQIHTPTHILIYTGEGQFCGGFFNGKCFNRNYRLVFGSKCSSCDTFFKIFTKNKEKPFPLETVYLQAKQSQAPAGVACSIWMRQDWANRKQEKQTNVLK